jgi:hypothetical protein
LPENFSAQSEESGIEPSAIGESSLTLGRWLHTAEPTWSPAMVGQPGSFSFQRCGFQIVALASASAGTFYFHSPRRGHEAKVQSGENHRFTQSASRCGHPPVMWSVHSPSPSPEVPEENKSAPPWPRHIGRGVGAILFSTAKARFAERGRKKAVARPLNLTCRIDWPPNRRVGAR